jgi:hypothetical protein
MIVGRSQVQHLPRRARCNLARRSTTEHDRRPQSSRTRSCVREVRKLIEPMVEREGLESSTPAL